MDKGLPNRKTTMDTFISAIITIIVAAITGWISAKISYGKEIEKKIYEERRQLYVDVFAIFEELQQKPYLIYSEEKYLSRLRNIKAKSNLYASRSVLDIVAPFYERVISVWKKYNDLYNTESAEIELENRIYAAEETGESTKVQVEWEYQQEEELYMEQNLIESTEIVDFLNRLTYQIRLELKTE